MIIIKNIVDIDEYELIKCNNLIKNNFISSRINTYEKAILYYSDNIIVGFLGISHDNYLNQLCIDNNYRNRGYATKLIKMATDILKDTIYLFVDKNKGNTDFLLTFYEKQGFIVEYDNEDEYKMFK